MRGTTTWWGGRVAGWYSCITQPVLAPLGPRPVWNTKVFFVPITIFVPLALIFRSLPVAFQYPDLVALFARLLFEYLISRRQKKIHSGSSDLITENSTQACTRPFITEAPTLRLQCGIFSRWKDKYFETKQILHIDIRRKNGLIATNPLKLKQT